MKNIYLKQNKKDEKCVNFFLLYSPPNPPGRGT